jgi:hypothetical protein
VWELPSSTSLTVLETALRYICDAENEDTKSYKPSTWSPEQKLSPSDDAQLWKELLIFAHQWDMKHVLKYFAELLIIEGIPSMCHIEAVAALPLDMEIPELLKAAQSSLTKRVGLFDAFAGTDEFLHLSSTTLASLLDGEELLFTSDNAIFEGLFRWIKHNFATLFTADAKREEDADVPLPRLVTAIKRLRPVLRPWLCDPAFITDVLIPGIPAKDTMSGCKSGELLLNFWTSIVIVARDVNLFANQPRRQMIEILMHLYPNKYSPAHLSTLGTLKSMDSFCKPRMKSKRTVRRLAYSPSLLVKSPALHKGELTSCWASERIPLNGHWLHFCLLEVEDGDDRQQKEGEEKKKTVIATFLQWSEQDKAYCKLNHFFCVQAHFSMNDVDVLGKSQLGGFHNGKYIDKAAFFRFPNQGLDTNFTQDLSSQTEWTGELTVCGFVEAKRTLLHRKMYEKPTHNQLFQMQDILGYKTAPDNHLRNKDSSVYDLVDFMLNQRSWDTYGFVNNQAYGNEVTSTTIKMNST